MTECSECGEMHKTHPTREGNIGWQGHTCRCVRCLTAEVEGLRREIERLRGAAVMCSDGCIHERGRCCD